MTSQITKDINCVYLDAVIHNPTSIPIVANYSEEKNNDVLGKASDYQMSIVRFSIPGNTIPIRVVEALGTDLNTLVYSVTLERVVAGVVTATRREYLQWIPEATNILIPSSSFDSTGINSYQYYSLYNYQAFVTLVNNAFATAFTNLASKPAGATAQPYIVYDPKTKLMSLVVQQGYISNVNDYINIYMNYKLFPFFNSFDNIQKAYNNVDGKDYLIQISSLPEITAGTNKITIPTGSPGAGTTAYVMIQDYPVLYNWNTVKSIVFTSGTIPSRQEFQPSVDLLTGTVQQTGQQSFKPIITDMIPLVTDGTENRSTIVYNPSAEYRMVDLISDNSLRKLQISVWWCDNHTRLYPLMVAPDELITIKMLFRRKKM
jgi:hypothetical protein